ncbi:MAG: hypothetical protein EOO88_63685 [Pedobacter sp.]|nr:MAG: hypothetical protein EOO88_63685 [Pedobacter sp.]
MLAVPINLLQSKYPEKILAALDNRSILLAEASLDKDRFRSTPAFRTRKPRSRDIVDLCEHDEELDALLLEAETMVYYIPGGTTQHSTYTTDVRLSASTFDVVSEVAQAAVNQSLLEHGETVVREKRSYHIAAEVGRSQSGCYTSLFSLALPAQALKTSTTIPLW